MCAYTMRTAIIKFFGRKKAQFYSLIIEDAWNVLFRAIDITEFFDISQGKQI